MPEFFSSHPSFPFLLLHIFLICHHTWRKSYPLSDFVLLNHFNLLKKMFIHFQKGVIEDVLGKSHRRAVSHA